MSRKIWYVGLAALFVAGSAALGNVQYISETGSVEASGTVWPVVADTQSQDDVQQWSDVGSFNKTAQVNLTVSESVPGYAGRSVPNWLTSYSIATQNSSVGALGITESGSLDYYTTQTYAGNGAASALSSLSITFSTDSELAYTLFFLDPMPPQAATLIDVSTGQVLNDSINPVQGVLAPGEYTLSHVLDYGQAYHDTSAPVSFGLEMSFLPTLAVPEPSAAIVISAGILLIAVRTRRLRPVPARC